MSVKQYQTYNVLEASKDRISKVFDDFEKIYISFSGGKDSTAMLHMMIDKKEQIDEIMFFETGWDFPEMEDHIKKVEANIGRKITRVRFYRHFDELLQRWGWPHHKGGWCVRCKVMTANQFARNINCTTECIGFSSSEEHRTKRITINSKKWI